MKINVILGTTCQSFEYTMPVFFCIRPVFTGYQDSIVGYTMHILGARLVIEGTINNAKTYRHANQVLDKKR